MLETSNKNLGGSNSGRNERHARKFGDLQPNSESRDQACRAIIGELAGRLDDGFVRAALGVLMDRDDRMTGQQLWAVALLLRRLKHDAN